MLIRSKQKFENMHAFSVWETEETRKFGSNFVCQNLNYWPISPICKILCSLKANMFRKIYKRNSQWNTPQRCEPFINKCGWNNSSRSFHLILLTPLDPLARGKESGISLDFQIFFSSKDDVLECVCYFFYISRFLWLYLHQYHEKTLLFLSIINFALTKNCF